MQTTHGMGDLVRPTRAAIGNLLGREDAINANRCLSCKTRYSQQQVDAWPMSTQEEYCISGVCWTCQIGVFQQDVNKCTCDDPCCSADVGVGVITCGSQHCLVHGDEGALRQYDKWQEEMGK
jgi:hypothetical protein